MKELSRQQDRGNKDTDQAIASSLSKHIRGDFRVQTSGKQFSGTASTSASINRCALLFFPCIAHVQSWSYLKCPIPAHSG